jgi:hypothetical protein
MGFVRKKKLRIFLDLSIKYLKKEISLNFVQLKGSPNKKGNNKMLTIADLS